MKLFKGIKESLTKKPKQEKQPPKIVNENIEWQGTFWSDGKRYPLAFSNMGIKPDGQIYGNGTDTKGTYTLTGTVDSQGIFHIEKNRAVAPVPLKPST
jgi:hypothetical protein